MMTRSVFTIGLLFVGTLLFAQKKLPTIKAVSKIADIKDGDNFLKGYWTITPEAKPDIYKTSTKNKKVTFYTGIDSISFLIKENHVYNFNIVLNGKDTALTQIKYVPGYLDILKAASQYNRNDNRPVPRFVYQSKNDSNLMALKTGFKLDSIAGEGNEVSKILNLLHWVHNLIPHDGNHGNPVVKNAMSMIAECKRDNRGLNCRGLSTVLNECYLALGIQSRFVTCMPKDSVFDDCHVINMVYAKELKKWLWIDPTNDAYVMNEKGELLSIEEVRERVITGKTVILNPEANWNRKSTVTKEEYLYKYMAKNLYRMQCPLVSEFDTETAGAGKKVAYIELLPLDAFQQTPRYVEYKNQTGVTVVYKTNNPGLFWAVPE